MHSREALTRKLEAWKQAQGPSPAWTSTLTLGAWLLRRRYPGRRGCCGYWAFGRPGDG
jgi:hypothetical protein